MGIIGIRVMITVGPPLDMILHALAPDGQLYTRGPMDHNGVRASKSSPQSEVRTVRRFLRIDLGAQSTAAVRPLSEMSAQADSSGRHGGRLDLGNKSFDDGPRAFLGATDLEAAAHLTHSFAHADDAMRLGLAQRLLGDTDTIIDDP